MRGDYVTLKRFLINTTSPGFRRRLIDTRDTMLDIHARWRNSIGWVGAMPDFIVAGAQKGGTTELYEQLVQHPQVMSALAKEVHYFDANFDKGNSWYMAFFPRLLQPQPSNGQGMPITGEASPCYIFHPHAAKRIWSTVPRAKIILLLRNPADRAYSHYLHERRLGYETLSFEQAIAQEPARLDGEKAKMLADERHYSTAYMHYSYLHRGIYIDQLQPWHHYFEPDQMLILRSEDFYTDTAAVMSQVYAFLGLPEVTFAKMERHKSFPYPKMARATRERLLDYFEPYNRRLYEFLGRDFCWT
jgi:hypothetical protein